LKSKNETQSNLISATTNIREISDQNERNMN